jgi:PIN domain nuclease of toxin-antitoxin system
VRGEIALSAISLWELGYLVRKKKVAITGGIAAFWKRAAETLNAYELPIDTAAVLAYHELPDSFHGDPGDRFLVAQAVAHGLTLLTADEKILSMRSKLAPGALRSHMDSF